MKSVCLAILNYNGKSIWSICCLRLARPPRNFPAPVTVVVLDNQSTDDDVAWIEREFPSVQAIVAPKNDFLFSYNWLAQKRTEDILVLLNNDLKVDPRFPGSVITAFRIARCFFRFGAEL